MNEATETTRINSFLPDILEELLGVHECVCVPGFGGFLRREHCAAFNRFTGRILPDHTTVFFNEALNNDDGLLGNLMARRKHITYNEASQLLRAEVQRLLDTFKDHRQHPFGNLGIFFCNQESRLFFIPSTSLNLHATAYGLMEVQLRKPAEEKPRTAAAAPSISFAREEQKPITQPEIAEAQVLAAEIPVPATRFTVWKVAAALALMTLGAALVVKLGQQFTQTAAQQQAEVISVSPEAQAPAAEPKAGTLAPVQSPETTVSENKVSTEASDLSRFEGAYQINGGLFLSEKTAVFAGKAFSDAGYTPKIIRPEKSTLYRLIVTTVSNEAEGQRMIDSMRLKVQAHYSIEPSLLPSAP